MRHLMRADPCALRRQLEKQLQEAEKLAEGAAQRRRQAEAQAAALQAELEAARLQRSTEDSDGDGGGEAAAALQLRVLQDLLQQQEDEVMDARRLKSHVRCAPGPGRRLSGSDQSHPWRSLYLPMCLLLM